MKGCKDLKTDSMEYIGMKGLGTLHHVSFSDEFFLYDVIRRSKCSRIKLGRRQHSICVRVAFFEDIEHVMVCKFENGFYGVDWNDFVGYITSHFIL